MHAGEVRGGVLRTVGGVGVVGVEMCRIMHGASRGKDRRREREREDCKSHLYQQK